MNFNDKVILITGASSGIGADAARHLSKLGGKVAIVGRNEERLHQVAEEIQSAGSPTPLVIVADITKDAKRIMDETIEHFGKLNVLVNNAGIGSLTTLKNIKVETFDHVMNTNVRSVVELTQLAVPHLEKTKGNVVNVSSIAGLRPIVSALAYCMSKAALDQFTKCVSLELGPKGIRVNSVNPGIVRTPMLKSFGMNEAKAEQYCETEKQNYPLGRIGVVSDISAAIAFLASDSVNFITGILLPVDGGKINN